MSGLIKRDGDISTLCHIHRFACQQKLLKRIFTLPISSLRIGLSVLWPYSWQERMLVGQTCVIVEIFPCNRKMLKMFSDTWNFISKDRLVWLWHLLINLHIKPTILPWYGLVLPALALIVREGGLSTLCHGCQFAFQQRVLKTFPRPCYLPLYEKPYFLFPNILKRWSFQKNCTGIWSFLYYQEGWYFFFPKIWPLWLGRKGKMIFLKKYLEIW